MNDLNIDRLRRLRGAVAGVLGSVPESREQGLAPALNLLRLQVMESVPDWLRAEAAMIAPEIPIPGPAGKTELDRAREASVAHAYLAALLGWLDSVLSEDGMAVPA